jgi:hypothetical protein
MPRLISNAASDQPRLCKSKRILAEPSGTYNLFRIMRYTYITNMWLWIITPYNTPVLPLLPGNLQIGFTGNAEVADTDGFMDVAQCAATVAGYKLAADDAQPCSKGKYFDAASGMITATLTAVDSGNILEFFLFTEYYIIY